MRLLHQWISNTRKVFLLDAVGACLTALTSAGILIPFQKAFGMPRFVLEIASVVAGLFALYSFLCYLLVKRNRHSFLKAIAVMNSLYCFFIAIFTIHYLEKLTILGKCYFVLELAVLIGLITLEIKTAYKFSEK